MSAIAGTASIWPAQTKFQHQLSHAARPGTYTSVGFTHCSDAEAVVAPKEEEEVLQNNEGIKHRIISGMYR
jgi:hypothetical protein